MWHRNHWDRRLFSFMYSLHSLHSTPNAVRIYVVSFISYQWKNKTKLCKKSSHSFILSMIISKMTAFSVIESLVAQHIEYCWTIFMIFMKMLSLFKWSINEWMSAKNNNAFSWIKTNRRLSIFFLLSSFCNRLRTHESFYAF